MYSPICLSGGVSAMRLGMMKGTEELGLPSASSTMPKGSFSTSVKVLASTAVISLVNCMSFWPIASRTPQRLSEAMQSSGVTGWPSWNFSPSRSTNV